MDYKLIRIQGVLLVILMVIYFFAGQKALLEVDLVKESKKNLLESLDVSRIGEIEIIQKKKTILLKKESKGNRWFVQNTFQSPIKEGLVDEKLLKLLRSLKKGYSRTKDPKEYFSLGINTARETRILLKSEDQKLIQEISFGDFNEKDKTYYVKLGNQADVYEIPELKKEDQKKFSSFIENEQLNFTANRQDWIQKKLFPSNKEILHVTFAWGGNHRLTLSKNRRDPKGKVSPEEKEAGVVKGQSDVWVVQKHAIVEINRGGLRFLQKKVLGTSLADQRKAKKLIHSLKNIVASDIVAPMVLKKTETDLAVSQLQRYGFQPPKLLLGIQFAGKSQDSITFGQKEKGAPVYFYPKKATEKKELIHGKKLDFITVYKWNQEESSRLERFLKTYKDLKSWKKNTLLLSHIEESFIQKIELLQNTQKKDSKITTHSVVTLVKNKKIWLLEGKKIPADPTMIQNLFKKLKTLKMGTWVGEWKDKHLEKEFEFHTKGLKFSFFPKSGSPIILHIGKEYGGFTYIRIENHGTYSQDIFKSPVQFARNIQKNAWSDFRIFAYKDQNKIQKIIFELPTKILILNPIPRRTKKEPTKREKASGIQKNDPIYWQVQEFSRKKYAPYDPLKLPYKQYIAKKTVAFKLFKSLEQQKAKEFTKVIWEQFQDKDLQDYNLLQYALRLRIRLKGRAGEDTFDFGMKGKEAYLFASLDTPYSRILKLGAPSVDRLLDFTRNASPDKAFVKSHKAILSVLKKVLPKKETPKKETPKKVTPKNETPKKVIPKNETPKKVTPKNETPKKVTSKNETPKKVTPKNEKEAPKATPKEEASKATPKEKTPKATPKTKPKKEARKK